MEIIPKIQKSVLFEEDVVIAQMYSLENVNDEYENVVDYLKSFIDVAEDCSNKIIFCKDSELGCEEYKIDVDENITVTSNGAEGAFRAMSTLKQLFHIKNVKKQSIHDYPTISNRGVMIDISRGKQPKFETLLEIVDLLADIKYNQMQLYIDGFVFEYEHFKHHCEGMYPFTAEQIRELEAYCSKKYISLVPNQNSFGHMEKWLVKDEFKNLAITRDDGKQCDTLNPLDEKSLELVDTIYSDLLPCFKSGYLNIGGDETTSIGMGQTKQLCEEKGTEAVYVEFLNKVFELANNKYNKVPMFWDDIVFKNSDVINKIKGECIFMDWGYETEASFSERCSLLQKLGLRFYTCPGTSSWGSITGRFDNAVCNIESAVRACKLYGGEGFLLTDWGDGGNPQFLPASLLLYVYGASCSWNLTTVTDCRYNYISNCKEFALIKWCEEYVDEFIFKAKGIGKLLHKMANYYLLENNNYFNGTLLWCNFPNINSHPLYRHDKEDVKMIITYMNGILEQLSQYSDSVPYIEEIRCNCEMVIVFSKYIYEMLTKTGERIKNDELKNDLLRIRKNFVDLWRIKNKDVGHDIFCKRIDDAIDFIE